MDVEKYSLLLQSLLMRLKEQLSFQITNEEVDRIVNAVRKISAIANRKDKVTSVLSRCCNDLISNPNRKYQTICDLIQSIHDINQDNEKEKRIDTNKDIDENQQAKQPPQKDNLQDEESILRFKLHRLQYLLVEIKDRIRKLDECELSIDDLDSPDSAYLRQSKLEKRAITVCKHINKLSAQLRKFTPDDPLCYFSLSNKFNCRLSRYSMIDKEICSMVMHGTSSDKKAFKTSKPLNKKGKSLFFPDYHDIRSVIHNLILTNKQIREEAENLVIRENESSFKINEIRLDQVSRQIFTRLGGLLQSNRRQKLHESLLARVPDEFNYDHDPALVEPELKITLDRNYAESVKRINQIVDSYAEISCMQQNCINNTQLGAADSAFNESESSAVSQNLTILSNKNVSNEMNEVKMKEEKHTEQQIGISLNMQPLSQSENTSTSTNLLKDNISKYESSTETIPQLLKVSFTEIQEQIDSSKRQPNILNKLDIENEDNHADCIMID